MRISVIVPTYKCPRTFGGFNPDSFGDFWLGDGEGGLNRKLRRQGMLVGYVPGAVVYHHIPPQRMANEGGCTENARFHEGIPGPVGLALRITRIGLSLVNQALATPAGKATATVLPVVTTRYAGITAETFDHLEVTNAECATAECEETQFGNVGQTPTKKCEEHLWDPDYVCSP